MKLLVFLAAFGISGTILGLLLSTPSQRGDGAGRQLEDDHHPLSSRPSQGSESPTPEDNFPSTLRGRRHLTQGGIEVERNFLGEIRDWARTDPDAAIAWAQLQPDSDDARKEALTDACFQIAQTQPQRAIVLAEEFKLSRSAVLQNLAQQWAAKDLPSACQWISEQFDDDQRNALATGAAFVWSQTAPADAARFVVEQMTPGSTRDAAVMMVIHQWALTDPAAATTWIEQFPEGPLRDDALGELTVATQSR